MQPPPATEATGVDGQGPLSGLLVLDFTNDLPGPLATLMLCRAGARVVKVERPPAGDPSRGRPPTFGSASARFALLNEGKESLFADLRDPVRAAEVRELALRADVLVEGFRPGAMARLGFDHERLARENPRLVYCSISGYGQSGPLRDRPGHDLNYLAMTGVLAFSAPGARVPEAPAIPIADIAGGAYPAFANILLALIDRDRTGRGRHLDIAMAENMFALMYRGLAAGFASEDWPGPGEELAGVDSPRYRVYRAADGRYLAVAALEDHLWESLCERIGVKPSADATAVATRIAERPAATWEQLLSDVACTVVRDLSEAVDHPHFAARRLFERPLSDGSRSIPALPLPLAEGLQDIPARSRHRISPADS